MRRIALSLFTLCCLASAQAQHNMEIPKPEKVVAFASGTLVEGVGKCDLPITTKSEKARKLIQQGYAMIHCFWFDEAIRSMRDATAEDPTSAGAWLGLNVALTQPWARRNSFRAEADFAIQRAVQLSADASPIEQALIVAYRTRSFGQDRPGSDFEKAMDRVIADFPTINEPRLLMAGLLCQVCMWEGYNPDGSVRGDLERVIQYITPVMKRDPNNHAAFHYHIHAHEPMSPALAIRSAQLIGKAAPRSSHMVHMAGHIFTRVGMYDEAIKAFEGATAIEEADAKTLGVSPAAANWNYPHNLDFLTYTLSEAGQIEKALTVAKKTPWSEIRIRERMGDWAWLDERNKSQFNNDKPSFQAIFYRGMRAIEAGDYFTAKRMADIITAVAERTLSGDPAKFDTQKRKLQAMRHDLVGAELMLNGKVSEGAAELRKAIAAYHTIEYSEPVDYPRPPYETLGWMLLRNDRPNEAERVFREGMKDRPNSYWYHKGIEAVDAHRRAQRQLSNILD